MTKCETCQFYDYDEEYDDYICTVDMDEDDYVRFIGGDSRDCPFWRGGDDYATARKQ